MSSAKLKIDFLNGLVEAEGSESFVLGVYSDFKNKILSSKELTPPNLLSQVTQTIRSAPKKKTSKSATAQTGAAPKSAKKFTKTTMPKLLKDLDLSGKGKHQRLKDFFNQYEVKTNFERNLIFVYYLNQILEISEVTVDSVFTCYREISTIKAPGALRQSLIDTSHNRGWIDTQDMDSISVTIVGINYIEHDMAKKVDA